MNYFDFFYQKNKIDASKAKEISNINLKIHQYINYGIFDEDSRHYYYMISFISEDFLVPIIMQISLKELWNEIKNHIKMGESVTASGILHYDYNNNLDYIEIKEVIINNIKFNQYDIYLNNMDAASTNNIKGKSIRRDKNKISVMVILFFVYIFLMYIFSRLKAITAVANIMDKLVIIVLVLFLLNAVIIFALAYTKNKKRSKKAKIILEQNDFCYIEQSFLRCSEYLEGALQKTSYKEEIVNN